MRDNNTTKRSRGLSFTQWSMNTTVSEATKLAPYKTLFGVRPKVGLSTNVPADFLGNIESGILEEELTKLIDG